MAKVDDRQALRPTEAQLRWAQFHRKTRAQQVHEKLERLYQSPASPSDVPDALSADGASTTNSSGDDETVKRIRRSKPRISRGRRAMLRVSRRHYESRRIEIQKHGFQCSDDKENATEEGDEEDAIIAMFAEESVLKKHRKRRASRRFRREDDEQRLGRFEAAYHAMMMNLMPQEQPDITPAKGRWTRASHIPVAVSIDGRQYDDLKWGFSAARKATPLQNQQTPSTAPFDRRASWLVHVPARQSTSRRLSFAPAMTSDGQILEPENGHYDVEPSFFSPGQMKFDELVSRLQQRELDLQNGQEGTPLGQREAQGKAAKFREKYSRRHSSEGLIAEGDDNQETTDFLARDIYGFPYIEESPDAKSFDSQSQGGLSFGGESDFFRSARNMHDTVPEQGARDYVPNSLRGQSMSENQQRQVNVNGNSEVPDEPSPVQSSIGGESEFWRNTRKMHATVPHMGAGAGAVEQQYSNQKQHQGQSDRKVGKLQMQELNESPMKESPDSLVKRRLAEMDPNSPYGESPIVPKLSNEKLEPFTEGTRKWQPPLKGEKTRELDPNSIVGQRVQHMNNPSESDQDFPSTDTRNKLPNGKLRPFEDDTDEELSPLKGSRTTDPDSIVRRRVQEMSTSPGASMDQDSSSRNLNNKLSRDKLQPFEEETDEELSPLKGTRTPGSLARRRVEETSTSPDDSMGEDSPSKVPPESSHHVEGAESRTTPMVNERIRTNGLEPSPTQGSMYSSNLSCDDDSLRERSSVSMRQDGDDEGAEYERDHGSVLSVGKSTMSIEPRTLSRDSTQNQNGASNAQVPSIPAVKEEYNVEHSSQKGTLAASAAIRIGSRVGGMFSSMLGSRKEEDAAEMKAFASFRQTQDERRASNDDATSVSSYRLLPEGIRRAVKSFSTRELAEKQQVGDEVAGGLTPARAGTSRPENLSPEHGKMIHQRVMEDSQLIGDMDADATIIDTDGTTSDATYEMDPKAAATLFLSPAILSKRLHQAIRAIERHNWEQVSYLLSANPWLAEMTDVNTGQFLLHKLALYGAGVALFDEAGGVVRVEAPAAPEELTLNLIRMFPSSVHKFDHDGNLPLHMAAVSGNQEMCRRLGDCFPSGASVRNEEGLLPLHMAIQSCSSPAPSADGTITSPSEIVKTILGFFPGGVAVTDNDGNLPIHCAASALHGEVGVDIIYMLLDEADKQVENNGLLFRCTDVKTMETDDDTMTIVTDITGTPTESSTVDDSAYCSLVRNNAGHTALMEAIRARSGWEIIEAIACGPGGRKAALVPDANNCNALHLLVSGEFADPAAILSILKIAPHAAAVHNNDGMLPIEIACRQMMPEEVILALVLVDLPIDLDEKAGIKVREGFGGSWCFLTCECDDHYADVVEEVISICSYPQVRELCFASSGPNGSGGAVITRATPICRLALRRALRFVGRFEFIGSAALETDVALGLKVFEALDFGTEDDSFEDGRRVLLRCYSREKSYLDEVSAPSW